MHSFRIHCRCISQKSYQLLALANEYVIIQKKIKSICIKSKQRFLCGHFGRSDVSLFVDEQQRSCVDAELVPVPSNSQLAAEAFGTGTSEGWQERKDATVDLL